MPTKSLIRALLLPELTIDRIHQPPGRRLFVVEASKVPVAEYCPRCATRSNAAYDHRVVTVKDEPFRTFYVQLRIRKRRLWCSPCGKPFTEPVPGIKKGKRHTERYGRALLRHCERYSDLSRVRRDMRCSSGFLYTTLYRHLELEQRKRRYPWPEKVGIDEHFFRRNGPARHFVTMVVDHKNKRVMEVVDGKTGGDLHAALQHIEGRERVRFVAMDMCDPYRKFAREFFPNAKLVADKFHVLRLIVPAINRYRKAITGDRRGLPVRRLLLKNHRSLSPRMRWALWQWLDQYPELRELYEVKEALHRFYRIRGYSRAKKALTKLTDHMASSQLPEVKRLRRTLMRWRKPVLAYFICRLTNGRTEGFNLKAKLVKRRGYGYRSFRNYRLRLLNACAH